MGFGRKVGAFLGLVPDDQHPYAEGEEYSENYDRDFDRSYEHFEGPSYAPESYQGEQYQGDAPRPEPRADSFAGEPRPARAGRRGFSSEPVTQGSLAVKPDAPIRRDADAGTGGRPATVKLTGFAEARVIGEKYRDGLSVILDMTDMSDSDARRLVDFSAGLAFSLRGSIEKVAPKVFMLLPPDADMTAVASATAGFQDHRAYAGR